MSSAFVDSAIAQPRLDAAAGSRRFPVTGVLSRCQLPLLLLLATIWMARSPYSASNLEVPPDSVEYALAPAQVLETGHYQIIVEGRGLPPRYPPWFPLAVIFPVYALLGAEPGNAILGITFLAVAGVGIAWAIGRRIGGAVGGILAGLGVLALPAYSGWATQIMSDVPCTALVLGGCWLFLRIRARTGAPQLLAFWGAGVLIAVAALFRPVSAAMLLPFAVAAIAPWRVRLVLARTAGLLFPMLGAAAATFSYNAATFGSPLRNGYHFWSWTESTPLRDFFALSSVALNWQMLLRTGLPMLLIICLALEMALRRSKSLARKQAAGPLRELVFFVASTGIPMLIFHLFYVYPCDRFFLPILTGTAIIAGSLLGLQWGQKYQRAIGTAFVVLLPLVALARIGVPDPVPQRRVAADRIRENTPADAVVISAIDPAFLEQRVASHSARRIVPLSREVEYTRALFSPQPSVTRDQPTSASEARRRYLIQFVATEQIDELVKEARQGQRIFLDTTALKEDEDSEAFNLVNSRFRMVRKTPALYELEVR
jgi:4-amino-4-deoxy-L-arabinose transferase-like glycosyltransferase